MWEIKSEMRPKYGCQDSGKFGLSFERDFFVSFCPNPEWTAAIRMGKCIRFVVFLLAFRGVAGFKRAPVDGNSRVPPNALTSPSAERDPQSKAH